MMTLLQAVCLRFQLCQFCQTDVWLLRVVWIYPIIHILLHAFSARFLVWRNCNLTKPKLAQKPGGGRSQEPPYRTKAIVCTHFKLIMHFHAESKFGNKSLNFEHFCEKQLKILACCLQSTSTWRTQVAKIETGFSEIRTINRLVDKKRYAPVTKSSE